jgi:hypothetical protein
MWDGPEPITHHKSYRGKRRRFGKLKALSGVEGKPQQTDNGMNRISRMDSV